MCKRILFGLIMVAALGLANVVQAASSKVKVCHIPPGNPANFHTITISEKALPAHLAHGDLPGDCADAGESLCDDGDACTIDAFDPETGECFVEHAPVDCDDGLACTTDSCDSIDGCQSAPIVCDDGDSCTIDICSEPDGQCTSTQIDCGPLGLCLPETGSCDFPCDGITCEPIDQCHESGMCILPGECADGVPVADGTPCDDGNSGTTDDQCTGGSCQGTVAAACPCWEEDNFQNTFPPTVQPDYNFENACTANENGRVVLENYDKPVDGPRSGIFQASVSSRLLGPTTNHCFFSNFALFYFGMYPEIGESRDVFSLTDDQVDACIESIKRQARAHVVPGVAWDCWSEE